MVDAPEKIWAHLDIDGPRIEPERLKEIIERKTFLHTEAFMFPGTLLDLLKDAEALRAALEQVKRNNIGLHDEVQFMRNAAKENREAAERLARARVVTRSHVEAEKEAREIAAAARKLVRNTVDAIAVEDLVIRRILSALAGAKP